LAITASSVFNFAVNPSELVLDEELQRDLHQSLESFTNRKRPIPVPRRILRRLAGGLSRSRSGVLIAYLIRCLFFRQGEITAKGCCKASWIAKAFGISERSVFDARDYLIHQLGWLKAEDAPQRVMNQHGLWVSVNLQWSDCEDAREVKTNFERKVIDRPDEVEEPVKNFKGPEEGSNTVFADPPVEKSDLFADPFKNDLSSLREQFKNQNRSAVFPTADLAHGFYEFQKETKDQKSNLPTSTQSESGDRNLPGEQNQLTPDIRRVIPEDLKNYDRLCELRRQAIASHFISESEADKVRFFAAVVHARNVGKDPVKLFSWMLRSKRWEMITEADEEETLSKLKAKERGSAGIIQKGRGGMQPKLSDDAWLIQSIIAVYQSRRLSISPRHIHESLMDRDRSWTYARFKAGWCELNLEDHLYISQKIGVV
jgi:hypothetical protein